MTTSTTFDPTRIAALPMHGGIGQEIRLEPPGTPIPGKPEETYGEVLRRSALAVAIQRARTAFDHAETALLSTMKPKEYITKGRDKGKGLPPVPVPVGTRRDVKGSTQEWNGQEWVRVARVKLSKADVAALLQVRDCS